MSKRNITGLVIVLSLGALALFFAWSLRPAPYLSQVQNIIESPQTYDGEIFDKLVALGPDAVPAIAETLKGGVRFPRVLVRALAEFGDTRGVDAILEVLRTRAPYNDPETAAATSLLIVELEAIANESVCDPLGELIADESAHPRIRLASASVVARVCGGIMATDAANFIVMLYDNRHEYTRDSPVAFTMSHLYEALTGINNERAVDIILRALVTEYEPYILAPILDFVRVQEGEKFSNALFQFVNNKDNTIDLRLIAARSLVDRGAQPEGELRARIDELVLEARSSDWGQQFLEQAEALQRDSESRL